MILEFSFILAHSFHIPFEHALIGQTCIWSEIVQCPTVISGSVYQNLESNLSVEDQQVLPCHPYLNLYFHGSVKPLLLAFLETNEV